MAPTQTAQAPAQACRQCGLFLSGLLFVSIAFGTTGLAESDGSIPALAPTPLFTTAPPPLSAPLAQATTSRKARGRWVRNQRSVNITAAALRALNPISPAPHTEFTIDLFSDGTQLAVLSPGNEPQGTLHYRTWTGRLTQDKDSEVTLVTKYSAVAATIRKGRIIYEIKPGAGDTHDVTEIDSELLPSDHHPVSVSSDELAAGDEAADMAVPPLPPAAAADSGTLIDVMVVYTTTVKDAHGGQNGIEALIALGISLANTAFTNSQINAQFRLVHAAETAYAESGNYNTDLSRLQSTNDGLMDEVHALRNTHKADLVTLIEDNIGDACGVAYVMDSVNANFSGWAFSVVEDDCISGYTLAHELGHNMGSMHDRAEGGTGAYPYSFGHKEAGKFRTIMAYPCSPSCPRINRFSNPNVSYQGSWVTGVDHNTSPATSADNARAFTNALSTVANFRNSGDTTAPPAPANFRIISP
jgi:hypothetical protein